MAGVKINKQHRLPQHVTGPKAGKGAAKRLPGAGSLSSGALGDKAKEGFYMELSVLLTAGVDIKSALDLLDEQQGKAKVRVVVQQVREMIVGGLGLSDAMHKTGRFTAYEFHSVRIGEETGRLPGVLAELASFYKRRIKQRRQLIQSLSYPVIVLCTAIGAVSFMLSFIVPMFADVFSRFGGELPYITRVIIEVSDLTRSYFVLLGTGVALLGVVTWKVRETLLFRKLSGKLLLRLPVIGPVVRSIYLARLCGAMALLTSARVPLVRSISLVRQMVHFYPVESSLLVVESCLMNGDSLHHSLSRFPVYDRRLVALLRVGEETGKLDEFFARLALQYNEEVDHRSAVLGSMLEPVIIIFLGAVVGLVLMAMYLPLFELGTNLQ